MSQALPCFTPVDGANNIAANTPFIVGTAESSAFFDANAFRARACRILQLARQQQRRVAVLVIDLDQDAASDERLGADIGERARQEVARRLGEQLQNDDLLDTTSSQRFLAILGNIASPAAAALRVQGIYDALTQAFPVRGRYLRVLPHIGVSLFPEHGSDIETLVHRADAAAYHAALGERISFQRFAAAMDHAGASYCLTGRGRTDAAKPRAIVRD